MYFQKLQQSITPDVRQVPQPSQPQQQVHHGLPPQLFSQPSVQHQQQPPQPSPTQQQQHQRDHLQQQHHVFQQLIQQQQAFIRWGHCSFTNLLYNTHCVVSNVIQGVPVKRKPKLLDTWILFSATRSYLFTKLQDEHAKPMEEDTTLLHSIILMCANLCKFMQIYALLHIRPCCIF